LENTLQSLPVMLSCAFALVALPLCAAGQSAPSPLTYTPLATPCRAVDTRTNLEPIQGGTTRNLSPFAGGCNITIPADGVIVYVANVTVVPPGSMWYLTVWPAGEAQPNVSLLNSYDGRTKANAALLNGGTNGDISVFASNTTDFVLDISGYFSTATDGLVYVPVTPCRIIDTRNNTGGGFSTIPGLSSRTSGPLVPNEALTFQIAYPITVDSAVNDENTCNLSYQVGSAYAVNVTVVPINNQPVWATSVWGASATPLPPNTAPAFSNVNVYSGTDTANAAIINGFQYLTAFTDVATNLVVDVMGYCAPASVAPEGLSLYQLPPCRALDTRQSETDGLPAAGMAVALSGEAGLACPIPAGTPAPSAFVLNATVIPTSAVGYLTLWPYGQAVPTVSTLNANDGYVTSNMAIVGTGPLPLSPTTFSQAILAQASTASKADLVLDESGLFALNPATKQPVVVFLGDETTSQWPMSNPNWINKGVPGNTTAQMLARFQTDVIELHPDVVHILGGANDVKDGVFNPETECGPICGNLEQMSAMAQAAGIKVVVGTPLDISGLTEDEIDDLSVVATQLRLSLEDTALWNLVDYQRMGGGYTAMTSMAQAAIGYSYGTPMTATAQHILDYDSKPR
jgi:hypothetical protein